MHNNHEPIKAALDADFSQQEVLNLLASNPNPITSIGHFKDTLFFSSLALITSESGYSEKDICNLQQLYFFLQNLESKLTGKEENNG